MFASNAYEMMKPKFTKTGKTAKAINVDLSKDLADVSTFFDTVTTIDTLKAKA